MLFPVPPLWKAVRMSHASLDYGRKNTAFAFCCFCLSLLLLFDVLLLREGLPVWPGLAWNSLCVNQADLELTRILPGFKGPWPPCLTIFSI